MSATDGDASFPPVRVRISAAAVFSLAVIYTALHFHFVSAAGHLLTPADVGTPKLYHVCLAAGAFFVVLRGSVPRWPPEVLWYVTTVALMTSLAAVLGTPQGVLKNVVLALVAYTVGASLVQHAGIDAALIALRRAAWLLLIAVLVKMALNWEAVVIFLLAPQGHPILPLFVDGGPNLEATWMTLAATLFLTARSRDFWGFVLGAGAVSALYASRAGLIGLGAIVLFRVLVREHRQERRVLLWLGIPLLVLAALQLADESAGLGYVVRRFTEIGDEPGSLGRMALWSGAIMVFADHPLGVGLGNALPFIRIATGNGFGEGNVHNLYLQQLVELGPLGFVALGALAVATLLRLRAERWRDPLLAYATVYFALALIQFSGFEPVAWFILGAGSGSGRARTSPSESHGA